MTSAHPDGATTTVLLLGAQSSVPRVGGVAHMQQRMGAALTAQGVAVYQLFRDANSYVLQRSTSEPGETDQRETLATRRDLVRRLDNNPPDLVHIKFAMSPLASAVAAWAAVRRIPVVAHPQGALDPRFLAHHRGRKYPYLATLERPLRRAAAVVSITEGDYGNNARWFGPDTKHFIIPNIVDTPPAGRFRRPSGRRDRLRAVYFGRINDYHKGVSRLMAVAARMPDIDVVLVGAVEQGDPVGVHAVEQRPANVEFVGPKFGDELLEIVAASDVFLHPARFEGFGNTIGEALSVGCPTFVSQETYLANTLQTRRFGFVLDFTEPARAEWQLRAALAEPGEMAERTERGAEWVRDCLSSEAVGRQLAQVYDAVLGRRSVSA